MPFRLQIVKQIFCVQTVKDATENHTLFYAITDPKAFCDTGSPANVGSLVSIGEEQDPDEDDGEVSTEELVEEDRESNFIEGLAVVNETGIDRATIPEEVPNGLYGTPSAH